MSFSFPWIVYFASVIISWKYCAGYWVVGPVFAAACLLMQYERVRKGFSPRHLVFTAASVLTYALVYRLSNKGWRLEPELLDMLAGSFTAAVVLGSILMPMLHGMIFSVEIRTVRKVSLLLIASWYFTILLSYAHEALGVPFRVNYTLVAIAFWQGIYFRNLKVS